MQRAVAPGGVRPGGYQRKAGGRPGTAPAGPDRAKLARYTESLRRPALASATPEGKARTLRVVPHAVVPDQSTRTAFGTDAFVRRTRDRDAGDGGCSRGRRP